MEILVKSLFGSYLFGTNNENSDRDYIGVYIPEFRNIILNKKHSVIIKDSNPSQKNDKDDVDFQIFSIFHFFNLAYSGNTSSIEMLNIPKDFTLEEKSVWDKIRKRKRVFYSKKIYSFVGYCINQMNVYSLKGEKLRFLKDLISFFESKQKDTRLVDVWNEFSFSEFIKEVETSPNGVRQIKFMDKIFPETCSIEYVLTNLKNHRKKYGSRSSIAMKNQGIDWSAISHAYRVISEVIEICETGEIQFPVKERKLILEIKNGMHNFSKIETLISESVERAKIAINKSDFPDSPDRELVDELLLEVLVEFFGIGRCNE